MKIKVLCLDDNLSTLSQSFKNIFSPMLVSGSIPILYGGHSAPFEIMGFGETSLSVEIFSNTQNDPMKVCNEIDDMPNTEIFDIVLIDDDWGKFGATAGQQLILPKVIASISGICLELPVFVLFTQHWDQTDRAQAFCDLMYKYPGEQRRLSGLNKNSTSGLRLLFQRVITEKRMAIMLAEEKEKRIKTENALALEKNRRMYGIPISLLPKEPPQTSRPIIGTSDAMRAVYYYIDRYSKDYFHNLPVHLFGETGVGKEIVAEAIHELGHRKNKPFISINCIELSATDMAIVNGQIFGRAPGALGYYDKGQTGYVKLADGGTLFLDEIHRLPSQTQGLLLRFLQTGEYWPLNEKKKLYANVRVISASEERLTELADKGTFVPALIARLNAENPIQIPPLRERGEDIYLLFKYFLKKYCTESGLKEPKIPNNIHQAIVSHSWLRNVRGLENFVKNILVTGFIDNGTIDNGCLELLSKYGSNCINSQPDQTDEMVWCPPGLDWGNAGAAYGYLEDCERIAVKNGKVTQKSLSVLWNNKSSQNALGKMKTVKKEMRALLNWPLHSNRWINARKFILKWKWLCESE